MMLLCLLLCLLLPPQGLLADTPAETSVLYYDGSSESYFDSDGGWEYPRFTQEWEKRELRYNPQAQAVEFYQVAKQEGLGGELKYVRPEGVPYRPLVVFRLRNLGKVPLRFQAMWNTSREGVPGTSRWYSWQFPESLEVPADGEWHDLVFHADAAVLHGDPREMPPVPVTRPFGFFFLVCAPLPPGEVLHYQLSQIRGEENPGEACRGMVQPHDAFPREWTAGRQADFPEVVVEFPERLPGEDTARLVLRPDFQGPEWPALPLILEHRQEEGGRRWRIPRQSLPLTPFLREGTYTATLECGEARLAGESSVFSLEIRGRQKVEFPRMSVRPFGGRPTIWKGDSPMTGAMRATYTTEGPRGIQYFSQARIQLFGFCSTPTEGAYNLEMLTEYAPGKYNYAEFDRRMRNVLENNPQAMVIVRLYLHAPRWWSRQHPEELVRFAVPEEKEGETHVYISFNGRPAPSWASLAWREYTIQGLRKMMEFLSQTAYADHLAGFVLASGQTEEWMEWGLDDVVFSDYSPASEKAFRAWLRRRYGSDQALQAAWKDPSATLEGATQPTARERSLDYAGVMLPARPGARRIADYNRYHGENVAECIRVFCRAIKEATDGRLLAGAFYGYVNELSGRPRLLLSGHTGVESLLEAPEVDFLCSPTGYAYRQVGGEGFPYAMGAVDSLQLHNKFWFVENDIRTYDTKSPLLGSPDVREGDAHQQIKESMHSLLSGLAQWWFDVGYISFTGEPLARAIRDCVRIMEETTLRLSRESVAQVAVVLDETSFDWTTPDTRQTSCATRELLRTLGYLGAPVEVFLATDLEKLPERLRLLVLPMSLAWTPRQRDALDSLRKRGCTLAFLGTPGVIPLENLETMTPGEGAAAFTGLPLEVTEGAPLPSVSFADPAGEWLPAHGPRCVFMGNAWCDAPGRGLVAYLKESPELRLLGHYVDKERGGAAGLAAAGVREGAPGEGHLFFSGLLELPALLWESLYRKAGVHRYVTTPDLVWASPDVLAICVNKPGIRCVSLSEPGGSLVDMITGETFPVDQEKNAWIPFALHETRVLQRFSDK
ncbi:MAG: beta-galactosidase [Oligosphaeraceae bacterium]